MVGERDQRTLSDADVQAIALALEKSIADRFVRNAGLGVMRMAWRGFVLAVVLFALYAISHGGSR